MVERPPGPPADLDELLARARGLAGRELAWVAGRHGVRVPADLRRDKGWIGQLLELALGATAASRAQPDFPHLGVELKSLPVDARGRPTQSTYVCTLPLDGTLEPSWAESWVRAKLSRVLWVPVLGDGDPGARLVGTPLLWSPDAEEEAVLRRDWEGVAELVVTGELWHLSAHHGEALQVRPKAARADDHAWVLGEEGAWVRDVPRGFYLRASFTGAVLGRRLRLG
ncbi:MAG: DNA mismatch repair endonuclease MutH [Alphaproteobacteria bacterium]|nr:DNA mismatch repair endonuclease MutH [Alphaproteobacteria bacterium]